MRATVRSCIELGEAEQGFLTFIYTVSVLGYTEYAGLGIPVDSYIALRPGKTEMVDIGAYGRKAVFRPSLVIGTIQQKLMPLFDFLGPKLNLFSLTV